MKFKTITIVVLVALLTLSTPLLFAQPGGGGGGEGKRVSGGRGGKGGKGSVGGMPHGKWWNNAQIVKQINLTDEQKGQIQGVMIEYQKQILDAKNESAKLQLEFDPIMEADNFSAGKADELLEKIQEYRAKSMLLRGKMLIKFREILSKEQYLKLKTLRGRHRKGYKGGKGQRGQRKDKRGGPGRGFEHGRPPEHKVEDRNAWWQQ